SASMHPSPTSRTTGSPASRYRRASAWPPNVLPRCCVAITSAPCCAKSPDGSPAMSLHQQPTLLKPLQTAKRLAEQFAESAVERDVRGGTPKAERDALRASGLLALAIPTQYGGIGASWSETFEVVREFARVDSSIAH